VALEIWFANELASACVAGPESVVVAMTPLSAVTTDMQIEDSVHKQTKNCCNVMIATGGLISEGKQNKTG